MLYRSPLWEGFAYNSETGDLIREVQMGSMGKIGIVGNLKPNGYLKFSRYHKTYHCHRVCFEIFHNRKIKEGLQIDHIYGGRVNNRIGNLREVTNRENSSNQIRHRLGKKVGVVLRKGKYTAQIKVSGKKKHLGTFPTELEAHNAYLKALNSIGESSPRILGAKNE